ncbi:MAG TPA: ABC transporter permease [Kofleriaceae bacterium]|nr:ABC transporter permease [Kofleriaceae bacterium]
MNLVGLAVRNAFRSRLRTALTLASATAAVTAFIVLQTIIGAWLLRGERAAPDRVATWNEIAYGVPIPRLHADEARAVPGVKQVTWATWFEGRDPRDERDYFTTLAVDAQTYLAVYDELEVDAASRACWAEDHRAALIGDLLAQRRGWKPGDRVTLTSGLFPGRWEFHICGVYTSARQAVDRGTFLFRWDYLDESVEPERKGKVDWLMSRLVPGQTSADVERALDAHFADHEITTRSASERVLERKFAAAATGMFTVINITSLGLLFVVTLVLANTIAMGVKERMSEYGALRALGFGNAKIAGLIAGESAIVGTVAGVLGAVLAHLLIGGGIGHWLEAHYSTLIPKVVVTPQMTAAVVVGAAVVGALAAILPIRAALRRSVVDALRDVG